MKNIIELTEDQRQEVAAIDRDLAAVGSAIAKYDRGLRRELMDALQAQTEDLSDIPRAITAAEEWGKARAAEPAHEAEASQVQATLSGIREKIRDRVREFIKPVARKAASVATEAAAQIEADEKEEAESEGFPFVPSGKIVGLRNSAKDLERLATEPGGGIPYDDLKGWLANHRIS